MDERTNYKNAFKVWCNKDNNWESNIIVILPDGVLGHMHGSGIILGMSKFDDKICKYINLPDKYGDQIHVGHILMEDNPRGNKYVVHEVPGGFAINQFQDELAWDTEKLTSWESTSDQQTAIYISSNCMIIGNVFENKELLTNI